MDIRERLHDLEAMAEGMQTQIQNIQIELLTITSTSQSSPKKESVFTDLQKADILANLRKRKLRPRK